MNFLKALSSGKRFKLGDDKHDHWLLPGGIEAIEIPHADRQGSTVLKLHHILSDNWVVDDEVVTTEEKIREAWDAAVECGRQGVKDKEECMACFFKVLRSK